MALLDSRNTGPEAKSPTIRWQAAQNLGDLQAIEALPLLIKHGLDRVADRDPSVRRECIIAVGKMHYTGLDDERRVEVMALIRKRLVSDEPGAIELDHSCRMALINTLVCLGLVKSNAIALDSARVLHDVAAYMYLRRESGEGTQALGLMETALNGLATVCFVSKREVEEVRATRSLERLLNEWWPARLNVLRDTKQIGRAHV